MFRSPQSRARGSDTRLTGNAASELLTRAHLPAPIGFLRPGFNNSNTHLAALVTRLTSLPARRICQASSSRYGTRSGRVCSVVPDATAPISDRHADLISHQQESPFNIVVWDLGVAFPAQCFAELSIKSLLQTAIPNTYVIELPLGTQTVPNPLVLYYMQASVSLSKQVAKR
ncbi:uncharacterized protein LY79DRAFT_265424 [Colletotrichum navitas]|uniref:Uncharacterized protein n=1 Tax=Colletotrichum navitas TaxID=681940 RepID=A0AAD8PXC9_9PEZI|nr:uncharacterized protein LY79DRAFT_265424 [Colletotrichum navitas]KAK1585528.1 hypothetical protein LY79DRAFT_265424 [Colletotrichum navitas]